MTSFPQKPQHYSTRGVSYEVINNFCVSEPINLKERFKRNYVMVFFLALLTISSFGAVFTFSTIMKRFHPSSCFLDTSFEFQHESVPSSKMVMENTTWNDSLTLERLSIDRESTTWSRHEVCDSITYPPIVMGISATIWAAMFYVCSMTDRHQRSLIPNPWRIVLPAFIYFIVMTIWATYYTIYVYQYGVRMCHNLEGAFDKDSPRPTCTILLDELTSSGLVSTSTLYNLFYVFMFCVLFLWVLVLGLISCRCLFGKDFERTTVEIKTISQPVPLID